MKRSLLLVCLFFIFSVSLCSCGLIGPQKYVCDVENVKSVEIVTNVIFNQEDWKDEYTVLAEIPDCKEFVNKLMKVEHYDYLGAPPMIFEDYIVVKINFSDGNYDLIHPYAQSVYSDGKYRTGYFIFNMEQYEDLISDYLND